MTTMDMLYTAWPISQRPTRAQDIINKHRRLGRLQTHRQHSLPSQRTHYHRHTRLRLRHRRLCLYEALAITVARSHDRAVADALSDAAQTTWRRDGRGRQSTAHLSRCQATATQREQQKGRRRTRAGAARDSRRFCKAISTQCRFELFPEHSRNNVNSV